MESRRVSPAIISLIVVALIGAAAGGVYLTKDKSKKSEAAHSETPAGQDSQGSAAAPSTSDATGGYKDGTYSATGGYMTPGGGESITVKVTLASDVVSDVDATGSAHGGDAGFFQSEFLSAYKDKVVGKRLDEVSLSRVAGSSLTSGGFNRAIQTIRHEAKS